MDFREYQDAAKKSAIYPMPDTTEGLYYTVLGLVGEAGEVANKVKKVLRDKGGHVTTADQTAIGQELGDVLWYVAMCCREIGLPMSWIADDNIRKLKKRHDEGKLKGQGDNR